LISPSVIKTNTTIATQASTQLIEKRGMEQAHKMFLSAQRARVYNHLDDVTSEQIGRAHEVRTNGSTFFMVENSRGEYDEEGNLIEYKVTWTPEYGYICQCMSGAEWLC